MAQNGNLSDSAYQAHAPHDSALSVGSLKEEDAAKIRDLEDEVRDLAGKANTASQRFADYENEIRVLEAKLRQEQRKNSAPTIVKLDSTDALPTVAQQQVERPNLSRFGSLIGSRPKPSATQQNGAPPLPNSREKDLEEKLAKELTARIAAEKKVKEVNAEIEDLTATLFQQSNEMVATERKENAALREKLSNLEEQCSPAKDAGVPEKEDGQDSEALVQENTKLQQRLKNLEQREGERKRRLERLEAASKRIERVKAMLQPP